MANNSLAKDTKIFPFGEAGITIEFGDEINPEIHRKVTAFADYLDKNPFNGMIEYIPAFRNVTVFYDPSVTRNLGAEAVAESAELPTSYLKVEKLLKSALSSIPVEASTENAETIEIPVCYEGDFAPDLQFVADYHKMTVDEVIKIHTEVGYLVYMIGFAPGFPYLGGMSERIATPRRSTPRTAIPKGSVGIADSQTGAYPLESPGGWQIIGRTPVALFKPKQDPPILLRTGNIVKFKSITVAEYEKIAESENGH